MPIAATAGGNKVCCLIKPAFEFGADMVKGIGSLSPTVSAMPIPCLEQRSPC
ncbi:MAG: hypothetical protein ACO3NK_07515 [Prochlorotrichaceae cyanobacterium]